AAHAGRVGNGDHRRARVLEGRADALVQSSHLHQTPGRQAADGDDELRPKQPQLPVEPEGAELLLPPGRDTIPGAGRRATRVAAGDRGTVEGRVEGVLVETEPAAEVLSGAA